MSCLRYLVFAGAAVALARAGLAQSSVLSFSSGSGTSGTTVSIPLNLASGASGAPSSLQWTLNYPAGMVSNVTVSAGPAATAAGKTIACYANTCALYGLNVGPIANGTVATIGMQLTASAGGNVPIYLSNLFGASATGSTASVSSVSGSIGVRQAPTAALAQVAAGASLTTGLYIFNTSAATASYTIQFYDDSGNFVPLPFSSGSTSIISGSLPAHGLTYVETASIQAAVTAGWGEIVADPGVVVQAVFRNDVNGTYYQASMPASPGAKQVLMAYDNTTPAAAGQPYVTGIALANLDATNFANVVCTAYGSDGSLIANAIQVPALAPLGHWASYQFPSLAGLRGSIACSSNTNISATALRFLGSELVSLPVVPNPSGTGGSTQSSAIGEIAAGGTLATGLFILNGGGAAAPFAVNLFDDTGAPLSFPFTTGAASSISATLPAQGAAYFEADGSGGATTSGWAEIAAGSSVVVQAIFRNTVQGVTYEAAIPSTVGSQQFVIPFDTVPIAGQPSATGLAIANLQAAAGTVSCTAYDSTGTVIPNAISVPALSPLGHWASYQFPALAGQRGTIDCTSNTTVTATALQFLGSSLASFSVVTE